MCEIYFFCALKEGIWGRKNTKNENILKGKILPENFFWFLGIKKIKKNEFYDYY